MVMGIVALLLFALFFQIGVHPLRHEEPRRALVALEMLFRGNWIVPTEVGALYYNKPPVYNWLIILSYKIFGSYSELAVRFFSVLSFIGMGLLVFFNGKKYVSLRFGAYAALFFMVSVDILYYFSLTGEIDLFYSLITLSSFFVIYHYHKQKRYWPLFLFVYLLAAVGTLTKGLPSIAFVGISLLSWFVFQREFKKLFLPAHFVSFFLFAGIVAGYFWVYSWYEDPTPFLHRLVFESSQRTAVDENNGFIDLVSHLFNFPLTNLLNMMPATLLLPFVFRKDAVRRLREQPFITFIALTFAANILLYWISPGAKARYVYMLYPFPVMFFVYYYLLPGEHLKEKKTNILHRLIVILIVLVAAAGIAIPFIPPLATHTASPIVVAALTTGGALAILWLHLKVKAVRTLSLLLLLVWVRIIFNLTVIPVRAADSSEAQGKRDAQKIVNLTDGSPLHVLEGSMISRTTIFYIERQREQVLNFEGKILPDHYYMAYEEELKQQNKAYDIIYRFKYKDDSVFLIKFK